MIQVKTQPKCNISKKLNSEFDLTNLPDELRISTMTITCNLNTLINIQNVAKYIDLSFGNIVCVQTDDIVRTLIKLKKRNNKKKKNNKKKNFYNQASLKIDIGDKRRVDTKVFKNGALQMTGCKSIEDLIKTLNILCSELQKKKAIYDRKLGKIVPIPFVTNPQSVYIEYVYNFKIRMINSNFHIGFLINREKLFEIMKNGGIRCSYEPCIHACVNIKHNYQNKDTISVFVFESGAIIITGAKTKDHIVSAYEFITKFLFENYDLVVKNNIDDFLGREDIRKIIMDAEDLEVSLKESSEFDKFKENHLLGF